MKIILKILFSALLPLAIIGVLYLCLWFILFKEPIFTYYDLLIVRVGYLVMFVALLVSLKSE